jgi:hypothetical protein
MKRASKPKYSPSPAHEESHPNVEAKESDKKI